MLCSLMVQESNFFLQAGQFGMTNFLSFVNKIVRKKVYFFFQLFS